METRKASRINIDLKVISRIDEDAQQKFGLVCGKTCEINVVDISEGGVGILSKFFLPKGLIIKLEIEGAVFNLKEIMKIKGEIRYCKYTKDLGYQCGVKFLNLSDVYRETVSQFISMHERRRTPRIKLAE